MLVGLTAQKLQFRKWFRCQLDQRSELRLQCLEKLASTVIEYRRLWKVLREFPNASQQQSTTFEVERISRISSKQKVSILIRNSR